MELKDCKRMNIIWYTSQDYVWLLIIENIQKQWLKQGLFS